MSIRLDNAFCEQLILKANESPRKRSHYNLHQALDEPVQRLAIALKKGTYVRPHHHPQCNKWELLLALRGSVMFVVFNSEGVILEKFVLSPDDALSGIEVQPDTWHMVYPITDHAVIFEVKEGPYTPSVTSDFAQWAPAEGSAQVAHFLDWVDTASVGQSYKLA
ncbi:MULTISPECIES: WbuC family cupin fold metalloprotein [unclassified Pseudoalteromonas]|uniref:WbuC family cupin fold metalloprotein n=1 Tax=unclassified Pseudoalteromonas TaxID=194690 RepID=UPI002098427D|nr:WbuC family cupin fold metalloprotein [Pseudoalteromonas sp. XMcav2-N]MCO7189632.1 WbuC family cupin fold metalloprotein [Pseudoalteromonas sp. XMcav2-N]